MTVAAASYKGTLYQLPLYFETLLFMYNRRYMTDEDVPATTEELYRYMEENTGRGRYGFVEQHSTAYYSAAWIHGFGGSIIDDSGTPFPDEQAVRQALRYHLKFVAADAGGDGVQHRKYPVPGRKGQMQPSAAPGWFPLLGRRALTWASPPCRL